jgi:hypothetical protein
MGLPVLEIKFVLGALLSWARDYVTLRGRIAIRFGLTLLSISIVPLAFEATKDEFELGICGQGVAKTFKHILRNISRKLFMHSA